MDVLKEGQMVGECQAIFDSVPLFSVETKSYCAIGMVGYKAIKELLHNRPYVRDEYRAKILRNPFDHERDFFVSQVRSAVSYLEAVPDEFLRHLYHRAPWKFYDFGQHVFQVGQACDRVYVVMSGVVEVSLHSKHHT